VILADTSVWVTSSRKDGDAEAQELRSLLDRDELAITEVVMAEVLQGAKNQHDYKEFAETVDALHFFNATRDTWEKAARLSYELKSQGMITPLADLVIAVVALENDLTIYAVDHHFNRVPGLKLHTPTTGSQQGQGNP
jgi:predicted nucleic acid-binding protein